MPLLEVFDDNVDGDICYLVTPLLRNMDDPSFETVNNVIDFVDQTIEVGFFAPVHFVHSHSDSPEGSGFYAQERDSS